MALNSSPDLMAVNKVFEEITNFFFDSSCFCDCNEKRFLYLTKNWLIARALQIPIIDDILTDTEIQLLRSGTNVYKIPG